MPSSKSPIPAKFEAEFMKTLRAKNKLTLSKIGTRPVDISLFKNVIEEVLSNQAFVNSIGKQIVTEALSK